MRPHENYGTYGVMAIVKAYAAVDTTKYHSIPFQSVYWIQTWFFIFLIGSKEMVTVLLKLRVAVISMLNIKLLLTKTRKFLSPRYVQAFPKGHHWHFDTFHFQYLFYAEVDCYSLEIHD